MHTIKGEGTRSLHEKHFRTQMSFRWNSGTPQHNLYAEKEDGEKLQYKSISDSSFPDVSTLVAAGQVPLG